MGSTGSKCACISWFHLIRLWRKYPPSNAAAAASKQQRVKQDTNTKVLGLETNRCAIDLLDSNHTKREELAPSGNRADRSTNVIILQGRALCITT